MITQTKIIEGSDAQQVQDQLNSWLQQNHGVIHDLKFQFRTSAIPGQVNFAICCIYQIDQSNPLDDLKKTPQRK